MYITSNTTQDGDNQRATPRRACDQCVGEINGQNYPVENWGMGGAKIFGDFKTTEVGEEIPVTLKFKLHEQILRITHKGHVLRKTNDGIIAIQFLPLTRSVRTNFQRVIDDYNTREFAGSLV